MSRARTIAEARPAARPVGRPDGQYTQAVRILRMRYALMEAWPFPSRASDLASQFGVTERTVRRDMAALVIVGEAERHAQGTPAWIWKPLHQREEILAILDRLPVRAPEWKALDELLTNFRRKRTG